VSSRITTILLCLRSGYLNMVVEGLHTHNIFKVTGTKRLMEVQFAVQHLRKL
jgi:hypothetical protein